jgi:hypothetical protein
VADLIRYLMTWSFQKYGLGEYRLTGSTLRTQTRAVC